MIPLRTWLLWVLLILVFWVPFISFLAIHADDGECLFCLNSSIINPAFRVSSSSESFAFQLVTNSVLFLIILVSFSFLRRFVFFTPRREEEEQLPPGLFSWIWPLLRLSDEAVIRKAGLDGFVLILVTKFGMTCFSILTVFGIGVILPVNFHGGNNQTGLDRLSFSNLPTGSPLVWVHFAFCYLFSAICYLLLHWFYVKFIEMKLRYVRDDRKINHYAVMIHRLPPLWKHNNSLQAFMERAYGQVVSGVHISLHDAELTTLVQKRDTEVERLERTLWNARRNGGKEVMGKTGFLGLYGPKVNLAEYHHRNLEELNRRISQEQQNTFPRSTIGFVLFDNQKSRNLACHALHVTEYFRFQVEGAPEPRDLIWENIAVRRHWKHLGRLWAWASVILLMIFWVVPIVFASSITTLSNLILFFPFLEFLNDSPVLKGFIEGFLPTVSFLIFLQALPAMIRCSEKPLRYHSPLAVFLNSSLPFYFLVIVRLLHEPSISSAERRSTSIYFLFLFVNVFLIVSVSGTIFTALGKVALAPQLAAEYLATSLPKVAVFFMGYIVFGALFQLPFEFLHWLQPIGQVIRLWINKFPKDREKIKNPGYALYDYYYGTILLNFVIGIAYSTMAPLILPITTLFFFTSYFALLYQVCYVYKARYDSEGSFWPMCHNRLLWGLFVFQLASIGLFSLNQNPLAAGLTVPLLFATPLFQVFCHYKFSSYSTGYPLDAVADIDRADELGHLQNERSIKEYTNPALAAPPVSSFEDLSSWGDSHLLRHEKTSLGERSDLRAALDNP